MLADHGERFTTRCFTEGEQAYSEAAGRTRAERYAARFACKEAVLKALGTGWREGISWRHIEVRRAPSGQPQVALSGRCAELADEMGLGKTMQAITAVRRLIVPASMAAPSCW